MSEREDGKDLAFAIRLEALKVAEKKVGSRVKSGRLSVRQQALREVETLAGSPEIKAEARNRVLAQQSKSKPSAARRKPE
jgi:hypothetical protein